MAARNLRETNDPDKILAHPLHEVLARLEEDSNKLYAKGNVDVEVLRRLVEGKGSLEPEQGRRLEEALRYMRSVASNAASARRAIERLRSGE